MAAKEKCKFNALQLLGFVVSGIIPKLRNTRGRGGCVKQGHEASNIKALLRGERVRICLNLHYIIYKQPHLV